MCENREHRFRATVKNLETGRTIDVVTYAKGIAPALARLDAWAATNLLSERDPGESAAVEFTIHRTGYTNRAFAKEHGADFVFIEETEKMLAERAAG